MNSIEEVTKFYTFAESRLKENELLHGEIRIVVINELRYAGSHIIKSLSCNDDIEKENQLESAIKHCKRAIYDSYEISILNLLESIKSIISENRSKLLKYDRDELQEIEDLMCSAREKYNFSKLKHTDSKDNFDIWFQEYDSAISELENVSKKLQVIIPFTNSKQTLKELTYRKRINNYVAVVAGLVSLSAALISIFLGV